MIGNGFGNDTLSSDDVPDYNLNDRRRQIYLRNGPELRQLIVRWETVGVEPAVFRVLVD